MIKTVTSFLAYQFMPSLQQPLVIIDYTEEMKTAASERAYSQLSKSARALAIEIYEEFDRRGNLEGIRRLLIRSSSV